MNEESLSKVCQQCGEQKPHSAFAEFTDETGAIQHQDICLACQKSLHATSEETKEEDLGSKLKSQIWQAYKEGHAPPPGIEQLISLPITQLDVYYLLERWGTLTVWDAFNLDSPSEKKLLSLAGTSEHFNVFDRGSSLIMAPKSLFSNERTILDGIKTAKALANEIYNRKWTIEMAGLDKWMHAFWVELQHLGDKHGHNLDIVNYMPTSGEIRTYNAEVSNRTVLGY